MSIALIECALWRRIYICIKVWLTWFSIQIACTRGENYRQPQCCCRENIFDFNSLLAEMQIEKRIVVRKDTENNVYLAQSYYTELAVAKMLVDINIKAKYD